MPNPATGRRLLLALSFPARLALHHATSSPDGITRADCRAALAALDRAGRKAA